MARSSAEFARIYGSEDRVRWIASQPCCVCGSTPSEGHHVRSGGTGRKAHHRWIVPLCRPCHIRYHHRGRETFLREAGPLMVRFPNGWSEYDSWDEAAEAVHREATYYLETL